MESFITFGSQRSNFYWFFFSLSLSNEKRFDNFQTNLLENCLFKQSEQMHKQMKLFNEIRGFLGFFQIFGLWPSWKNPQYKVPLIIYSICYICFVVCMFFSAIFMNEEWSSHTLSAIVENFFLWSILLTHFVVLLEALINRNAQMRLIQKLAYADFLLKSKLQMVIDYRDEKSAIFIRFAVLIFISIFVRSMLTIHLIYQNRINIYWYLCLLSVWTLRLRILQIIFFVFLLRNRLNFVKEKLREFLVSQNIHGDMSNDWPFFRDSNKIFVLDACIGNPLPYERLLNLKQIYGELYEICELINITFGWSILTIVAQNFIEFIGNSYWIFLALGKSPINLEHVVDSLILFLPITLMLGTMVFYCASCSRCVSFSFSLRKFKNFNFSRRNPVICFLF